MAADHLTEYLPTKVVDMTPAMIASKQVATRRRSSKNLALRALHKEKMKRETGSLMHSKQDPKSDLLCCVKSEGLCRNIGAKHHRRNKQCWNFPNSCFHCKEARATLKQESPTGIHPLRQKEDAPTAPAPQQVITPTLLNQLINKTFVESNSKCSAVLVPQQLCKTANSVHAQRASLRSDSATQKLHTSIVGCRQVVEPCPDNKVMTIESEDDEPSEWKAFTPSTPDLSVINDLGRRTIRSSAPSPEVSCQRIVKQSLTDALGFRGHVATRDPRLDINYVLQLET